MRRFIGVAAIALLTSSTVIRCLAEEGALPKDVFPESRNRLPLLKRENVTDRARRTYDTAVANFAGAEASGAAIRLHASPVTNLQMESPVGLPLLQLAILTTGREHDQPFEWSLHEMQALAVGLDPAVIDVVRRNQPLTKLGDKEAVIIQVGRELFRTHKLGSGTYARALSLLGQTGLVDVVALMADLFQNLRDPHGLQSANAPWLQAISAAAFLRRLTMCTRTPKAVFLSSRASRPTPRPCFTRAR